MTTHFSVVYYFKQSIIFHVWCRKLISIMARITNMFLRSSVVDDKELFFLLASKSTFHIVLVLLRFGKKHRHETISNWARFFKTNSVVVLRFVKILNINI